MHYEAVIFDLDDTLVVEEPGAVDAFMEICRESELGAINNSDYIE